VRPNCTSSLLLCVPSSTAVVISTNLIDASVQVYWQGASGGLGNEWKGAASLRLSEVPLATTTVSEYI